MTEQSADDIIPNLVSTLLSKQSAQLGETDSLIEDIVKRKPVLSVYYATENNVKDDTLRAMSELSKIKITSSRNIYLN